MAKIGEVGCFEAGRVMMARCLAIMQYHRRTTEEIFGLCDQLAELKRKVVELTQARA